MKKVWIFLLITGLFGCYKEAIAPPCKGGCDAFLSLKYPRDVNGYYHIKLIDSYSYFPIYVEATDILPEFQYNGVSAIEAWFDTNTYWEIQDSLMVVIPLYRGFGGIKSSPYWSGTPLAVGHKSVYLSQFAGMLVPIIQLDVRSYFSPYEANNNTGYISEYKPKDGNLWTKKEIGPIPLSIKGDTVQIYVKVIWEGGTNTIEKNNLVANLILE